MRNFTYDGFGRLLTATTGAGATVTYSYNSADQLTGVSYSDGTTAVSYVYNTAGRLYQQTDATGTTTYSYDALGNLLSRTGGGQPTVTYSYDLDGNESSTTDGRGTSYATFDAANQQTSLTTAQGTLLNFGYDSSGRRTDTWFNTNTGNTTWSAHTHVTFDANGSVQEQATYLNNSSTAAYDNVYCRVVSTAGSACTPSPTPSNNRSQIQWTQNKISGTITSYSYDTAGRLQTASTPGGTTYNYTYDARGNRLTAVATGSSPSSQTLTYNPANQITTTGYSYDGAGNLTASPALGTASYNAAGQMSADTTPSSGSGTYSYAGADQTELVSQAVPGGSTFSYGYGRASGSGVPILESITSISGSTTKNGYLDNDAGGTPEVFTSDTGAQNYYVTDGEVGSPIALINTSGTQTAAYSYDPYGTYMTTSSTGSAAGFNPARFAGGIYDRTTGDLHYGQRWYDDSIGRFTQQDSVSHLQDLKQENRYAYAGDDPINNTDPTGDNAFSDFFTQTIPNAIEEYGPSCLEGGVQGLAVGLATGETETGIGAAGAFAEGCGVSVASDVVGNEFGEQYGDDIEDGGDLADIANLTEAAFE